MRGIFCCSDEIARARVGSMVQRMFLSYTSKNGCGRSIGVIWGASVAGGQDFGADGGNAWRIVGSTNGGATNVLFFLCWYLF